MAVPILIFDWMTKKQEPGGWKEGIFRILPTADIDR